MVVLTKLIRPCGFTSKATTPAFLLVKPCAASKGDAAWMVRCNGCSGGGKYYCMQCLSKFRRAILEHTRGGVQVGGCSSSPGRVHKSRSLPNFDSV